MDSYNTFALCSMCDVHTELTYYYLWYNSLYLSWYNNEHGTWLLDECYTRQNMLGSNQKVFIGCLSEFWIWNKWQKSEGDSIACFGHHKCLAKICREEKCTYRHSRSVCFSHSCTYKHTQARTQTIQTRRVYLLFFLPWRLCLQVRHNIFVLCCWRTWSNGTFNLIKNSINKMSYFTKRKECVTQDNAWNTASDKCRYSLDFLHASYFC